MDKKSPIAVFDSGLGGISVLKELVRLMPHENYIYFGDSKNAPYGVKTAGEVLALTENAVDMLIKKQAKTIVVACNTATSAAVDILRQKHPDLPVIGIEPALKPAAAASSNGRIVVMATAMTLREKKFSMLLEQYADKAEITLLPAPGIVEFVEKGITKGPKLEAYLTQLLATCREAKPDSIVLGCTHFPFVKDSIKKVIGCPVRIFDGAEGTAKETRRQLAIANKLNDSGESSVIEFFNSDNSPRIQELCRRLLET